MIKMSCSFAQWRSDDVRGPWTTDSTGPPTPPFSFIFLFPLSICLSGPPLAPGPWTLSTHATQLLRRCICWRLSATRLTPKIIKICVSALYIKCKHWWIFMVLAGTRILGQGVTCHSLKCGSKVIWGHLRSLIWNVQDEDMHIECSLFTYALMDLLG